MKKKIVIEQSFCDVCEKKTSGFEICIICGKEFCYECEKTEAINYKHGVSFSGSGAGLYCLACDKEALKNGDVLHAAYRRIAHLRNEAVGYWADFEKRKKEAEEKLSMMLKELSPKDAL